MSLPQTAWVKLNCLQTSIGQFHFSMHKCGLPPSPKCECCATEQTADHILIQYISIYVINIYHISGIQYISIYVIYMSYTVYMSYIGHYMEDEI